MGGVTTMLGTVSKGRSIGKVMFTYNSSLVPTFQKYVLRVSFCCLWPSLRLEHSALKCKDQGPLWICILVLRARHIQIQRR